MSELLIFNQKEARRLYEMLKEVNIHAESLQAKNADLRKQLSERDELMAEIKKTFLVLKPLEDHDGIVGMLSMLIHGGRWPSSSRSSTKEEPKA